MRRQSFRFRVIGYHVGFGVAFLILWGFLAFAGVEGAAMKSFKMFSFAELVLLLALAYEYLGMKLRR
jgi:hypothetical protein